MVQEVGDVRNEGRGWLTEVWEPLGQSFQCEKCHFRLQVAHLRPPKTPHCSTHISNSPLCLPPCNQTEFSKAQIWSHSSPALSSLMAPFCPQAKIHTLHGDLRPVPVFPSSLPLQALATLISFVIFPTGQAGPCLRVFPFAFISPKTGTWQFPHSLRSLLKYSFFNEFFPHHTMKSSHPPSSCPPYSGFSSYRLLPTPWPYYICVHCLHSPLEC